jgi:nicotinate (nicotinamide) nucleotide adenylyltransferase
LKNEEKTRKVDKRDFCCSHSSDRTLSEVADGESGGVSTVAFVSETRDGELIRKLTDSKHSRISLVRKASKGIPARKGRLGIFPASFNPPTKAHLALVKKAKRIGKLDEILVLLDIQAMDKTPVEARFEDRLEMLKMAFEKDPSVSIGLSNRGLFLEKLNPLRRLYSPSVRFVFIVGFDTFVRIMDDKYYGDRDRDLDRLFEGCRFLVANRGALERQAFVRLLGRPENKKYGKKFSFFTLTSRLSTLSSTLVRQRIGRGRPIEDWIPRSILRFIEEKTLYRKT